MLYAPSVLSLGATNSVCVADRSRLSKDAIDEAARSGGPSVRIAGAFACRADDTLVFSLRPRSSPSSPCRSRRAPLCARQSSVKKARKVTFSHIVPDYSIAISRIRGEICTQKSGYTMNESKAHRDGSTTTLAANERDM
jgi:hypothetical protein